jgi:integrase
LGGAAGTKDGMKRVRYQSGSLDCLNGVWTLRYYEHHADGSRPRKAVQIGTAEQYPTRRQARKAADEKMREVNESAAVVRFDHLCDLYAQKGIGHIREYSQSVYRSHIRALRAAFGSERVDFLATPAGLSKVDDWLRNIRISAAMRRQHRGMLALIFRFAMKQGMLAIQANPATLVDIRNLPQNTTPKRPRVVVSIEQFHALLGDELLPEVCKVLLQLCTMTGVRSCEAIALKWSDVDFAHGKIYIRRSAKGKYVDEDPKSLNSRATVPVEPPLASVLRRWKKIAPQVGEWMFGSLVTSRPLDAHGLQKHLREAGDRLGIPSLGWHNFRHTHRALARQAGASLEEQKLMMRHATIQQSAEYGNDGIDNAELIRRANRKVISILSLSGLKKDSKRA